MSSLYERRPPYPKCPDCGGPVVGGLMTTRSVTVNGRRYYDLADITVYCCSSSCNYDRRLAELPYPPKEAE